MEHMLPLALSSEICRSYHISFLREDSIIQTLQSHPFHWQLHRRLSILLLCCLSEIVPGIGILCQTKVSNLYHIVQVNPDMGESHISTNKNVYLLHAVPSCEVTMNKLIVCQVFHAFCNLQAH